MNGVDDAQAGEAAGSSADREAAMRRDKVKRREGGKEKIDLKGQVGEV
jgi:hypothetical protein